MKKQLLGLSFIILAGAGCSEASLFTYEVDETIEVSRRITEGDLFGAPTLLQNAEGCGTAKSLQYYETLVATLEGINAEVVTFTPIGDYQTPTSWSVFAIPNVLGYKTMQEFNADFAVCWHGGIYPFAVSENVLLFHSGCGSGYEDGSGREIGCIAAQETVASTIFFE